MGLNGSSDQAARSTAQGRGKSEGVQGWTVRGIVGRGSGDRWSRWKIKSCWFPSNGDMKIEVLAVSFCGNTTYGNIISRMDVLDTTGAHWRRSTWSLELSKHGPREA